MLNSRTPADNEPVAVTGTRPPRASVSVCNLKHVVALIRKKEEPCDAALGESGVLFFTSCIVNENHVMCRISHAWSSGLTTQAQRPGARDAMIATTTRPPGSLQRMVRRIHVVVSNIESSGGRCKSSPR